MSKIKSKTKNWVKRQSKDINVRLAKKAGYRSRAAYKLIEIDDKHKLIKSANNILELGCAPGSWSQVVLERKKMSAKLIGIDLLDIKPINNLEFIQGNFTSEEIIQQLATSFPKNIDLLLSDAAPDISGIKDRDNELFIDLHQAILDILGKLTTKNLLIKTFNGPAEDFIRQKLKKIYQFVTIINTKATRSYSKECYILAKS